MSRQKNLNLNSISDLTIEASKKRFTFDIAVGMSPTFEIPDFLYLLVKAKVITKSNGLRLLDTPEDVNTYCLLGDATDKNNVKFTCFGYNDNLDENSQITLSNFTSEYINFNEGLSLPYCRCQWKNILFQIQRFGIKCRSNCRNYNCLRRSCCYCGYGCIIVEEKEKRSKVI